MKNYNQISPGLENIIINKIHKIERNNFLLKQSFYSLISISSFIGIIYSFIYISKNILNSGIFSYLSLIFSDIQALTYWKEISLSILESLPFLGLALGFGVLGIFLWSILKTMRIQVLKNMVA